MNIVEKIAMWGLVIGIGYLLQLRAIDIAQAERGYEAYGGEYLVLPLVIAVAILIEAVWKVLNERR